MRIRDLLSVMLLPLSTACSDGAGPSERHVLVGRYVLRVEYRQPLGRPDPLLVGGLVISRVAADSLSGEWRITASPTTPGGRWPLTRAEWSAQYDAYHAVLQTQELPSSQWNPQAWFLALFVSRQPGTRNLRCEIQPTSWHATLGSVVPEQYADERSATCSLVYVGR